MKQNRRRLLLGSASAMLMPVRSALVFSDYPNRPITFICPWPVGGTADLTMRALARVLSQELLQQVDYRNITGASGMTGVRSVVTAKPDGYTIGMVPITVSRMAQLGMVNFDPLHDLTYLARTYRQSVGIVVRADSPYRTLGELMAAAKASPGNLTYGSTSFASACHIGMEEFLVAAGLKMHHVAYKGGAPAMRDLRGGQVDVLCDSISWAADVRDKKLRLLAAMSEQRLPQFSRVPTLREVGFDVVVNAPNGVAAPAGLDPQVRLKLRGALRNAVASAHFRQICESIQAPVMYQDADEYSKYVFADYERQKSLIKRLNLEEQMRNI
ncbi:MAG: Bug family tripartite tricarboxylate transporter substrate binding protein [Burkholderiaceae bacterium]